MSTKSTSTSESKSSPLNEILQTISRLSHDEMLELIAYLAQQARQTDVTQETYYWRDMAGIAPDLMKGQDAQEWVIRYGRNGIVTALSDSIDAGNTLFPDSAPVICFVEHHPVYFALLEPVDPVRAKLDLHRLWHPARQRHQCCSKQYRWWAAEGCNACGGLHLDGETSLSMGTRPRKPNSFSIR